METESDQKDDVPSLKKLLKDKLKEKIKKKKH